MSEAVLYMVPDGLMLDDGVEKVPLPDTVEAIEVAISGYQNRVIRAAMMSLAFDEYGHTQLTVARCDAAIRVLEMRLDDLEGVTIE